MYLKNRAFFVPKFQGHESSSKPLMFQGEISCKFQGGQAPQMEGFLYLTAGCFDSGGVKPPLHMRKYPGPALVGAGIPLFFSGT